MNSTLALLVDSTSVEGGLMPQARLGGSKLSSAPFTISNLSASHDGGTPSIPYIPSKLNRMAPSTSGSVIVHSQ